MPPQLVKNHVVPTSWQDEALTRHGVSREVPCSALNASSALQGRFLTTEPLGKAQHEGFKYDWLEYGYSLD